MDVLTWIGVNGRFVGSNDGAWLDTGLGACVTGFSDGRDEGNPEGMPVGCEEGS